jgi:hypothetical protein
MLLRQPGTLSSAHNRPDHLEVTLQLRAVERIKMVWPVAKRGQGAGVTTLTQHAMACQHSLPQTRCPGYTGANSSRATDAVF